MFFFDFMLILFTLPAVLLALFAQYRVSSAYREMSQIQARMSGFHAARKILDDAGLYDVNIEQIPGEMTDHYDPREKVLRLSPGVYQGYSMAAVGIAAHEAGHALQDAKHYAPLKIRNLAVPAASIGSNFGMLAIMIGFSLLFAGVAFGKGIMLLGILMFGAVVVFQLVNLPVEFNASSRAKTELLNLGIISGPELPYVSKVLNAAALTYVAATLHSVLTLAYYAMQFAGASGDRE
jgi:Zn-dependent membrane protease YugP